MNRLTPLLVCVGLSLVGCASFDQELVDWRGQVHRCNQSGIGVIGARMALDTNERCMSSLEQLGYVKAELHGQSGLVLATNANAYEKHGPIIQSVTDNSPAQLAGAKAGDYLLKVNGEIVHDVQQARRLMFGAVGTELVIEAQRGFLTTTYTLRLESAESIAAGLSVAKADDASDTTN